MAIHELYSSLAHLIVTSVNKEGHSTKGSLNWTDNGQFVLALEFIANGSFDIKNIKSIHQQITKDLSKKNDSQIKIVAICDSEIQKIRTIMPRHYTIVRNNIKNL